MSTTLYGLVAEFTEPAALLCATKAVRMAGYRAMDAYTPFAVEGLAEELGIRRTGVPLVALLGGIGGGSFGLGIQMYSANWAYPLNVGGRPFLSWTAFVPIAFELTILGACLSAIFGMLALNRLPQPHHPIFDTPHFAERNASRFYLCIESRDALFDLKKTRALLAEQAPEQVWEVPT